MSVPNVRETGAERRLRIRKDLAAYKAAIEAGTHTQEDYDDYIAREQVQPDEAAEETFGSRLEDVRSTIVSGIPFGSRARAGYQALANTVGIGTPETVDESMSEQGAGVARMAERAPASTLALQVLPSLALPFGPLKQVARVPGVANALQRGAVRAGNAATTGLLFGAGEADRTGRDMVAGAGSGATTAVAIDAGLGLLGKVAPVLKTVTRVANARPLDRAAHAMDDAMRAADDALYGATNAEARALGSSPEIRDVLESQTVKPFADRIRASETHAGANDAEVLLEAYKGMSAAQRRAGRSIEGTADYLHEIELRNSDIGMAKGRMRDAISTPDAAGVVPIPSAGKAIDAHRTAAGEYDAFMNTSDAVRRILENTATSGKKLLLNSPEALRREIANMTPGEARAALDATLGRAREAVRFSANPMGNFGIVPSIARATRAPFQIDEFVRLLEKRAGIPHQKGLLEVPDVVRRGLAQQGARQAGLLSPEQ